MIKDTISMTYTTGKIEKKDWVDRDGGFVRLAQGVIGQLPEQFLTMIGLYGMRLHKSVKGLTIEKIGTEEETYFTATALCIPSRCVNDFDAHVHPHSPGCNKKGW